MSYDNIFSDWLASSFDNISATKEWNIFISDLHDSVEHQLAENSIDNFNNLLDHEKTLIIQRALQSLSGSVSYQIISDKISQTLDLQINNEAERIIRIDINPFHTRTEAILAAAYEGIVSILGRWQDLKYKLTVMFNQNIPKHLRHHMWKAILSDQNVLDTYRSAMKTKSKDNISKYDKEISQYCESLLNNEAVLSHMKGSVGCFYGMKAVLSYFQARTLKDQKLQRHDYLLMIPIVYVLHEKLSLREPPSIKVMEVLVQEYFSLRQILTDDLPFLNRSDKSSHDHYRIFCQQVYRHIVTIDLGSAQALMDHIIPSQNNIVATETKLFDKAGEIIERLLRPVMMSLFVGFLSMETLVFVWDQFLLGFDKPMFRDMYWTIITAIFLEAVVKRRILNRNKSVYGIISEELMKDEGVKLRSYDFQYQINKNFYVEIMRIINSSNVFGLDPIADSNSHGVTRNLKWKHWFDTLHHTSPISPQNRLDLRILRQREREKLLELQKDLENKKQETEKLAANIALQAKIYSTNFSNMAQKLQKDRHDVKLELESMKQQHNDDNNLIDELKQELEKLRSSNPRQNSLKSYRLPLPPAGTPVSPSNFGGRTPLNSKSDELSQFAQEFLKHISNSCQTILHGQGKEKFDLNDASIEFSKAFEIDKRQAELNIFGKNLTENDLRSLDNANEGYYSQKIYQEVARIHDAEIGRNAAGNSTF